MTARRETETVRQWLHLAPGALAFAVRDLGFAGSVGLATALLAFNLWVFPRLGAGRLWRPGDSERGVAVGIVSYPAALLLLALACRGRLEVLAGAWGMLAFGDAAATLVGRRWGRRPLPWNAGKSWVGAAAFVLVSTVSISVLVEWTAPGRAEAGVLLVAATVAAVIGAIVESLPWALDDNCGVTLLGGAGLYVALTAAATSPGPGAAGTTVGGGAAIALAVALALAGRWSGAFDGAGAATAFAVAAGVGYGGGWRALVLLAVFAGGGTWASRRRRRLLAAARPAGRSRGVRHVLANGTVAGACGLLAGWTGDPRWAVALAAALAVAAADTIGGELGLAHGGRTWRITDRREVEPGVDGGVSRVGLGATVGSAAVLAAAGAATGFLAPREAALVAAVGVLGALLDSVLGATLERRGLLDNEGVNFACTLAGAWLAILAHDLWTA